MQSLNLDLNKQTLNFAKKKKKIKPNYSSILQNPNPRAAHPLPIQQTKVPSFANLLRKKSVSDKKIKKPKKKTTPKFATINTENRATYIVIYINNTNLDTITNRLKEKTFTHFNQRAISYICINKYEITVLCT